MAGFSLTTLAIAYKSFKSVWYWFVFVRVIAFDTAIRCFCWCVELWSIWKIDQLFQHTSFGTVLRMYTVHCTAIAQRSSQLYGNSRGNGKLESNLINNIEMCRNLLLSFSTSSKESRASIPTFLSIDQQQEYFDRSTFYRFLDFNHFCLYIPNAIWTSSGDRLRAWCNGTNGNHGNHFLCTEKSPALGNVRVCSVHQRSHWRHLRSSK